MRIQILNNFIEFKGESLSLRHAIKNGLNIAVNLREALKEHAEKLRPFAKENVTVVIDTPYMLVPENELKTETIAEKMFRATISAPSSDAILHNALPSLQSRIVFSIDSDLKLVIEDNFPKHEFTHSFELMLSDSIGEGLVARLSNKHLDIFSIRQNRFRFANRFPQQSDDDTLFLVLSVWKQLALNQQKDNLLLLGETEKAPEELIGKLKQFIENTEYKQITPFPRG